MEPVGSDMEMEIRALKERLAEHENSRNPALVEVREVDGASEVGSGLGVFAARDARAGDHLCYYTGAYVPASKISGDERSHAMAINIDDPGYDPSMAIDGRTLAALLKQGTEPASEFWWACGALINSSQGAGLSPNVHVIKCKQEGHIHWPVAKNIGFAAAVVEALRPIASGEQLLMSYSYDVDYDPNRLQVYPVMLEANKLSTQRLPARRVMIPTPVKKRWDPTVLEKNRRWFAARHVTSGIIFLFRAAPKPALVSLDERQQDFLTKECPIIGYDYKQRFFTGVPGRALTAMPHSVFTLAQSQFEGEEGPTADEALANLISLLKSELREQQSTTT